MDRFDGGIMFHLPVRRVVSSYFLFWGNERKKKKKKKNGTRVRTYLSRGRGADGRGKRKTNSNRGRLSRINYKYDQHRVAAAAIRHGRFP